MRDEVRASFDAADQWSSLVIRDIVKAKWPNVRITRTEGDKNLTALLLDTEIGIDYLLTWPEFHCTHGLSMRVQGLAYARFNTFTIRMRRRTGDDYTDSEYLKGLGALLNRGLSAFYILHAYVDVKSGPAQEIVSYCLAHKPRLIRWINETPEGVKFGKTWWMDCAFDPAHGQEQEFICVPFDNLPPRIVFEKHNFAPSQTVAKVLGVRR